MGLFDINMPLLYGEGEKAFLRLQLEIWSATNDDSVFAWNFPRASYTVPELPLFAHTPAWFESSGAVQRSGRTWAELNEARLLDAMTVTNRGVDLDFRRTGPRGFPKIDRMTIPRSSKTAEFLLPLRCGPRTRKQAGNATEFFAILLISRADSTWYRSDQLGIVDIEEIQTAGSTNESHSGRMYIPHLLQNNSIGGPGWRRLPGVFFNISSLRGTGFRVKELVWEISPHLFEIQGLEATDPEGILLLTPDFPLGNDFSLKVAVGISEPSTNFVLLYEYTHRDSGGQQSASTREFTSLYVIKRTSDETLKDTMKRRLQKEIPIWSRDRSDRISWPIIDGRSMSAAVKRGVDLGRPNFIVYITLDEEGKFPWPVPFNADYRATIIERNKKVEFF
jgi:hypothetical protein